LLLQPLDILGVPVDVLEYLLEVKALQSLLVLPDLLDGFSDVCEFFG
jgi:hypothetical protein